MPVFLYKKKYYPNSFVLIFLLSLLLISCGGSSEDNKSKETPDIDQEEQLYRPMVEKDFVFEKKLNNIFSSSEEVHYYTLLVDEPVVIKVIADPKVYSVFEHAHPLAPILTRTPYFHIADADSNIFETFRRGSVRGQPVSLDVKLEEPGIYYIFVEPQLTPMSDNSFTGLSSTTTHKEYFLTVEKYFIDDEILGTDNNEILRGYDDVDQTIFGSDGNDTIYGMKGRNTIYGGAGDDIIYASEGADDLYGGLGKDIFVYTSFSDSNPNHIGRDTIHDFVSGQDLIDLSKLIYDESTFTGSYLYNQEPVDCLTSDVLWFENGILYGKLDASKECAPNAPDFSIALKGVNEISKSDFIF